MPPDAPATNTPDALAAWKAQVISHLSTRQPEALQAVLPALQAHPTDPEILLMAVLAGLLDERPEHSLRYLPRFTKRYAPFSVEDHLLRAIALAQHGMWPQAARIVEQYGAFPLNNAIQHIPCGWQLMAWFHGWIRKIERAAPPPRPATQTPRATGAAPVKTRSRGTTRAAPAAEKAARMPAPPRPEVPSVAAMEASLPPLPRPSLQIPLAIQMPTALETTLALATQPEAAGW